MKDIELDIELMFTKLDRIIELLEEMTYLNPYYEEEELPFMDRTVLDNYEDN